MVGFNPPMVLQFMATVVNPKGNIGIANVNR
jgi:hypothetical protein